MTSLEFINKQRKLWQQAEIVGLQLASIEVHRTMGERIFLKGEAANESLIGHYNTTTPIYVNPKNSPRKFPTGGKTGNRRAVKGQKTASGRQKKTAHKTAFFYSYRDFRQTIGRPVDKVNLDLSGRLRSEFVSGIRKVNDREYVSYLRTRQSIGKARGAERHFGKRIFALTAEERALFVKVLQEETRRVFYA